MSILEHMASLLGIASKDGAPLEVTPDSSGILVHALKAEWDELVDGKGSGVRQVQRLALKMLEEQGLATEIANGYRIPITAAVLLDEDSCSCLGIAGRFDGGFRIETTGVTTMDSFAIRLFATLADGEVPVVRRGPYLMVSSTERYLLRDVELRAITAWERHTALPKQQRSTGENARLLATLQAACAEGMNIDVALYKDFELIDPKSIGVTAIATPDGSLRLSPSIGGGLTPEEVSRSLGQIDLEGDGGVLRIGNRIAIIDKEKLSAVKEVMRNRVIPKERVAEFIRSPSAFLNAALVDLDLGFSVRVEGIGPMKHIEFGAEDSQERDWFGREGDLVAAADLAQILLCEEDVQRFQTTAESAWDQGAVVTVFDDTVVDIADQTKIRAEIEKIRGTFNSAGEEKRDLGGVDSSERADSPLEKATLLIKDAEEEGAALRQALAGVNAPILVDWNDLKRSPFPHQLQGVEWILRLMSAASAERQIDGLARVQGGLLADDMGLGKTYMALVAVQAYLKSRQRDNKIQKPTLVVAPLSLLANWEEEVEKTFKGSPFRDIVVLQTDRDLGRFRNKGIRRESAQLIDPLQSDSPEGRIRYALAVGPEAGASRLDMDGRLVLATYQTLRDYQFSMCSIDWGVVIFDEAQNIKNPNTYTTTSARGLKAEVTLLATGTPVENTLGDFWCLFETAQPGLLGTWPQFRQKYVLPIQRAEPERRDEIRNQIGVQLRKDVGDFMLRRTKESQLEGLPKKTIHNGTVTAASELPFAIGRLMRGDQLDRYETVLESVKNKDAVAQGMSVLTALAYLRGISIHHAAVTSPSLQTSTTKAAALKVMSESARTSAMIDLLAHIAAKGEKVILFLLTKRLQRSFKIWLDAIYGLDIGIVNGDTPAFVSGGAALSRKQTIDAFEARSGFNILIMSPVAAGVGLTVVGANHVIHVERHWNPAKESQATDRVYRIGQTKDVHVYLPASLHPTMQSFDVVLDGLLKGKMGLKDAVLTCEDVDRQQIAAGLFRRN